MRNLVLLVSVVVSGCQCLVPVSEDAGSMGGGQATGGGLGGGGATGGGGALGGGSGGGSTGGGGVSGGGGGSGGGVSGGGGGSVTGGGTGRDGGMPCSTSSQCAGPVDPVLGFCSTNGGAWSCAFGECVKDCAPGRTCTAADAGCMTCDGVTTCVGLSTCPAMTHLYVESSTCGFSNLTLRATSLSSQVCTWAIEAPDGGTWGTVTFYGYDDVSANLPALGGPCVGAQLPTGAIRFSVGCSDCMLSVRPLVVGP